MKTPDRCRTGTPPSAEYGPQGSILVFRATEDPPSGLLQLLFIQSRKVNSPKFAPGFGRWHHACGGKGRPVPGSHVGVRGAHASLSFLSTRVPRAAGSIVMTNAVGTEACEV